MPEVGAHVERDLDGLIFEAVVARDNGDGTINIRYSDDGNIEVDVPLDEVKILSGLPGGEGSYKNCEAGNGKENDGHVGTRADHLVSRCGRAGSTDEAKPQVLIHGMQRDTGGKCNCWAWVCVCRSSPVMLFGHRQ